MSNSRRANEAKKRKKASKSKNSVIWFDTVSGQSQEIELEDFLTAQQSSFDKLTNDESKVFYAQRLQIADGLIRLEDVKRMIDVTFSCAFEGCPDVWYPVQYALQFCNCQDVSDIQCQLLYFLGNVSTGLNMSVFRAKKFAKKYNPSRPYLTKAEVNKTLAFKDRLEGDNKIVDLNEDDYRALKSYVVNHELCNVASLYYECGSGMAFRFLA